MAKACTLLVFAFAVTLLPVLADDWSDVAQSHAVWVSGKVIQVIPMNGGGDAYLVDQEDLARSALGYGYVSSGVTVLAVGAPSGYVDGDIIHGDIIPVTENGEVRNKETYWYYAGVFHYTSVTGATVTVRIYTPNLDWAIANLTAQSSGN